MKKIFLQSYAIILIFSLMGCKKDKEDFEQETKLITGQVVLPLAMNQDVSGYSINSCFTEQVLTNKEYSVEVSEDDFNTQFVTDKNGKDILLGFTYPEQTDFTIDSKSTLMALLMKLPAVNSLTTEGKLDFMDKIKNNDKYSDALNAVEKNITEGRDIFDTTNFVLHEKLASLFDESSLKVSGFGDNILFYRNDKTLTFSNPGNAYVQEIGIYKDGQKLTQLELDRYQVFATSITGIVSATGNNAANPIEKSYTVSSDGTYTIKVRNGGFNTPNSDGESLDALEDNTINLVIDNLKVFIPIDVSKGCNQALYNAVKSKYSLYKNAMRASEGTTGFLRLISSITGSTVDLLKIGIGCEQVSPTDKLLNYFNKVKKYLKVLDLVNKVGTNMNNTVFTYQYFTHPSSMDTTFTIGNDSTVTDIDGNVYHTVKIGTQTWLVENLKTTRYNDGTAIPNVTNNTQWANLTYGAYCFYDNNTGNKAIYGALYNWYAVNTGKLAPKGWHVPNEEEWQTLINYLGGENIAGNKMRSVSSPWVDDSGATNSSGFSALPAGGRLAAPQQSNRGTCYEIGFACGFWSLGAVVYELGSGYPGVDRDEADSETSEFNNRGAGNPVRCIKD